MPILLNNLETYFAKLQLHSMSAHSVTVSVHYTSAKFQCPYRHPHPAFIYTHCVVAPIACTGAPAFERVCSVKSMKNLWSLALTVRNLCPADVTRWPPANGAQRLSELHSCSPSLLLALLSSHAADGYTVIKDLIINVPRGSAATLNKMRL
jgi:hypothetical protein